MLRPLPAALVGSLLVAAALPPLALGQNAASPAPPSVQLATQAPRIYPLEVELVSSIHLAKLQVGDHILTKARSQRTYGTCTVVPGSVLEGEVTAITPASHANRHPELALHFQLPCEPAPPLTWIALLAPDTSGLRGLRDEANPVSVQALRSATFGETGGVGRSGNTQADHVDMSGHQSVNFPAFLDPAPDRRIPRPTVVLTGQVWQLPDLSLHVAAGPRDSTVVSSKGRDLRIPRGAVLVLMPPHPARGNLSRASAAGSLPSSQAAGVTAQGIAPPPLEDLRCEPLTCASAPPPGVPDTAAPHRILPLRDLGYRPLTTAAMQDLAFGAALAFLDRDHLLFTFNPHALVERSALDRPENHPRMIRGEVFDLSAASALPSSGVSPTVTPTLVATRDWRVSDTKQYLWPLSSGDVLLHAGNRLLRLSGPDLQVRAALVLPGPLAFLRVSPDLRHILVGTIEELHTASVHEDLVRESSQAPEEQVASHMLDAELRELVSPATRTHSSSLALPPILVNTGILQVFHAGSDRWHLRETTWDRDESRLVMSLRSACIPRLSSLASGQLLALGCDPHGGARWYRVLRPGGSLVLRGSLPPRTFGALPSGATADVFALAIPEMRDDYAPSSSFYASDLASEQIRVHSGRDGRTLFATRIDAPSPSHQAVALSPDGTRLAVLDGEGIRLYDLAARNAAPTVQATSLTGGTPGSASADRRAPEMPSSHP